MAYEASQEPSISPAFNRRHALIFLLTVITLVHLPSIIARSLWIEHGVSKNDFVTVVVWPCLSIYIMLLYPILLIHIRPEVATFNCVWFRWKRSEFVRLPLLMIGMFLVASVSYVLFGILRLPKDTGWLPLSEHNKLFWTWMAIRIALLGPVAEEVFWRGYVQSTLSRISRPWIAIIGQALLFGLLHLRPIAGTVQMCSLGLIFGIWSHKQKTLLPIIIAHIANNSIIVALLLIRSFS